MSHQGTNGLAEATRDEAGVYRHGEDRPLEGYVLVMAVFAALVAGGAGVAAAAGRRLPDGISPWDLLLITAGTHKLSRTLSKDAVTSPLRVPFTRYGSTGGPAEVMEDTRTASDVRHAIGELVTCPFCLDMWIATGFAFGYVFAPRVTRLVAATFTALAGADFLQLLYAKGQQAAQ
ncbi:uncharacterized protein DUF1360 [Pseudonocardia hierapolitana]|uniref:Uncharacterized protein DUF1360 n=1 Tax=Pseudonocardia hierapolitana TaxID=1128676 RepID=A0A561T4E8_9PSEU|nr:DUF1360 domain-containing protein [Pseudonocardia hierapolitana]TWF81991.1 uncharacterized protein DUF1360 [Pseudonocardia hierapolitana]